MTRLDEDAESYEPRHAKCPTSWCGVRLRAGDAFPDVGVSIAFRWHDGPRKGRERGIRFCSWPHARQWIRLNPGDQPTW